MKYFFILTFFLFIQCKKNVCNQKFVTNDSVLVKNKLTEELEVFIKKNPLDYENEQLYMINFCKNKKNDTLMYFHKTFYTQSYFINNDFLEYKGWLSVNKEIVLVYDYTNSLGENIYKKDSLLDKKFNKNYTDKHTNIRRYMKAIEYKIKGNNIIKTGLVDVEKIGEKILNILDSDYRSTHYNKDIYPNNNIGNGPD